MEDRGNQLSLASFIGTFVYAIMILRAVRAENEVPTTIQDAMASDIPGFTPQLSLLLATGMMLVSVAVLVYFLNHIPNSIRINVVLERIGERLIRKIRNRFPENGDGEADDLPEGGTPVAARRSGYVEVIDHSGLDDIAKDHNLRIVLERQAGDFVHPTVSLARYVGTDGEEDIAERIEQCFVLSGLRTPQQDLRFLIDELVEIALRALSPGINDPFTAITALHWLGAATAELGRRELTRAPDDFDKDDKRRVYPMHLDFADYVSVGFGSARSAVAASPKATLEAFDTLLDCARSIRQDRVVVIRHEIDRLMDQAAGELSGPDLALVHDRHREIKQALA